ncbi:MAG: oligosaccharide flippase family protein, partial [Candidatus Pacebacteria bacterium]|nr:oligosaccharide flippase family protein [Candidatus Paceibacterota bacterium]
AALVIGKIAVLSRLLTPEDFGIFAIVAIALGLVEASTQTGVNTTILQSNRSISYYLDTAWVIAIVRGLIIAIVMTVLGFGLSIYYEKESLRFLVAIAALVPLIKGFINPSLILLQKEFLFLREALLKIGLLVAEILVAIVIAFYFHSVLALIVGLIAAALLEVFLSFKLFADRPSFFFRTSRAKEILINAKGLSPAALLSYILDNVDDLIVGKIVGAYQLGLYHNAYSLAHKPNYDMSKALGHSVFPVYTKIVDDRIRLRKAFVKSSLAFMGFAFFVTLPAIIFPTQLVAIVLGEQWLSVASVLPLLAIAGLLHSGNNLVYNLLMATKRYAILNMHLFFSMITLIGSLIYFVNLNGLIGSGQALLVARGITLPILIFGLYDIFRKR